jgi:hypothetical protein
LSASQTHLAFSDLHPNGGTGFSPHLKLCALAEETSPDETSKSPVNSILAIGISPFISVLKSSVKRQLFVAS